MIINYKTYDNYYTDMPFYQRTSERTGVNKKRSLSIYFLKQRLTGLLMIILGIISVMIDGDATFCIMFALPLGICLLFSKKKIMNFT